MELRGASNNRRTQARRMVPAPGGPRPSATAARQRTLQRRRSVLTGLAGLAVFTLIVGAVPAFRMVWVLHLVTDALLLAYVALLIHQRNVAAERDMKVRFLPGPVAMDPGLMRREPALLRRSAN